MFPKTDAAAYVMMAWRIAWFKGLSDRAHYAHFLVFVLLLFLMRQCVWDVKRLEFNLVRMKKGDQATKKEQDSIRDMRIVQEMYARGLDSCLLTFIGQKPTGFRS